MEAKTEINDTVSNPLVLEKYTQAGIIGRKILGEVIEKCVDGADISDICAFGDQRIEEEVKDHFLDFRHLWSLKERFMIKESVSLPVSLLIKFVDIFLL